MTRSSLLFPDIKPNGRLLLQMEYDIMSNEPGRGAITRVVPTTCFSGTANNRNLKKGFRHAGAWWSTV